MWLEIIHANFSTNPALTAPIKEGLNAPWILSCYRTFQSIVFCYHVLSLFLYKKSFRR